MSAVYTQPQVLEIPPSKRLAPLYPFLSQPPPQKKRPTKPLPPPPVLIPETESPVKQPFIRRRSATIAAIASWAAEVLPGTPTPYSPRRSPSSLIRRRSSLSRSSRILNTSGRIPPSHYPDENDSPISGNKPVITPCMKNFKPDLTAVGYTSVFIHFPETPLSPPVFYGHAQIAKKAQSGLKHFKSLTALKSVKVTRVRAPPSPSLSPPRTSAKPRRTHALQSAAVVKSKKSKYATVLPDPLANELALAQMMDGGSLDGHVKRFLESRAKAGGAKKVDGHLTGVGDVHRDGQGRVWIDQDEEWEFVHLLSSVEDSCKEGEWVHFDSGLSKMESDDVRRGSLSTQDSDLSPRYTMHVRSDSHDDLASFGDAIVPAAPIKPGLSVLAIPARSQRTAKHLRKPKFLLDAFQAPRSPVLAAAPRSPRSPRIAASQVSARVKRRVIRRPAPLKLTPPGPANKLPLNPADPDQMRREFLDDSFAPHPRVLASSLRPPVPDKSETMVAKVSIVNMREFFKAIGGKKANTA